MIFSDTSLQLILMSLEFTEDMLPNILFPVHNSIIVIQEKPMSIQILSLIRCSVFFQIGGLLINFMSSPVHPCSFWNLFLLYSFFNFSWNIFHAPIINTEKECLIPSSIKPVFPHTAWLGSLWPGHHCYCLVFWEGYFPVPYWSIVCAVFSVFLMECFIIISSRLLFCFPYLTVQQPSGFYTCKMLMCFYLCYYYEPPIIERYNNVIGKIYFDLFIIVLFLLRFYHFTSLHFSGYF